MMLLIFCMVVNKVCDLTLLIIGPTSEAWSECRVALLSDTSFSQREMY